MTVEEKLSYARTLSGTSKEISDKIKEKFGVGLSREKLREEMKNRKSEKPRDVTKSPSKPNKTVPGQEVLRLEGRTLNPYSEQFAILVPQSFISINGPLSLLKSYTVTFVEEPPREVRERETPDYPYEKWTRDELIIALANRRGIAFSIAKNASLSIYINLLRESDKKLDKKDGK